MGKDLSDTAPELTVKQQEFLDAYLDPESETFGNGVRSALRTYDTTDYSAAGVIAHENIKKLKITTKHLMDAKGIGYEKLLAKLKEGLDANRTISVFTGKDAKGTDMDFIDVPDHSTRHKYLKTAGDWYGLGDRLKAGVEVDDGKTVTRLILDLPNGT